MRKSKTVKHIKDFVYSVSNEKIVVQKAFSETEAVRSMVIFKQASTEDPERYAKLMRQSAMADFRNARITITVALLQRTLISGL